MKVLIVRLGALGDIVHAIPAAAALRAAMPDARIDWVVDARHRELVDLVPVVDGVVALEGRSLAAWTEAVRRLRVVGYDAALDFQGLMKSAILARASGARRVAGFSIWHVREKTARPFYSEIDDVWRGDEHVVRKNLSLLRVLGIEATRVEFPIVRAESAAVAAVRALAGPGEFALINPGAAWSNKRWPVDRFGELAAFLRDVRGLVPVVLWGPGERELARDVVAASSGAAIEAPPTRLADVLELARQASLMVAGDTGPLHLAAAVQTPIVAIMGPTNPQRNGPWAPDDVTVSRFDVCSCHYDRRCHAREWCLGGVPVAEVTAAVQRRLGTRLGADARGPDSPGTGLGAAARGSGATRQLRSGVDDDVRTSGDVHVRRRLARYRVRLGFLSAAVALWLARPDLQSLAMGAVVALAGEAVRIWAAGHLEKGRGVTVSGPYRLTRHPLYLGSAIIGVGFAVASNSIWVALLTAVYLVLTITSAIRSEERHLTDKFGSAYPDYREGRAPAVRRRFSVALVVANREYRAVAGLLAVLALLGWKAL